MPSTSEEQIKRLEERIKILEGLLLGINDDTRFKAKIRRQIFDGEHTAGKPTVVNEKGKKYNLQIV